MNQYVVCMDDAPSQNAERRPSSSFASEPTAVQLTEYTKAEYTDGRQSAFTYTSEKEGYLAMDEESTNWSVSMVTGVLTTQVDGTDNTISWLKEPTFTGTAGIWYQADTQMEPAGVVKPLELTWKAETGASALLGSLSAAVIAIAAVAY
jgi:hypothetical protein